MRRALQLARNGEGRVSPNPMVGAVIVHDGRIIGEGFHAFYGGPHAEVNAVNSVKEEERNLLKDSTIYVTLEPCAHFGKTPPCANMLVEKGIPNVVVGSLDPNPKVAGKGVRILQDAGIKVETGVLGKECLDLNKRFMHAHTHPYPWIILKWAESADGYMCSLGDNDLTCSIKFSTPLSSIRMHRERSLNDAIIVGHNTERLEHPRLNVRDWGGNSPKKLVAENIDNLREYVENLRKDGITSLMVEGGPTLLNSFIKEGLYNEIRKEISPKTIGKGLHSPALPPDISLEKTENCDGNLILYYRGNAPAKH